MIKNIKHRFQKGLADAESLAVLLFLPFIIAYRWFLGGFCAEYSMEYWLSHSQGSSVDVSYWATHWLGFFFTEPSILASLVTWIASGVI